MSVRTRLIAALTCWVGAGLLILRAGLPEHPAAMGIIRPDGERLAPVIGAYAPPFTARTHRGELLALDTTRITVINFWATWCIPCAIEMPELQALHDALPDIQVIAINIGEDPAAIEAWAQRYALTYPLLLDPAGHITGLYALRGQPTTFIVAPGGVIHTIFYGAVDAPRLRAALSPLLLPG
jgi:thiol-disulfide isomerase/thioredoxin